MTTGYLWTGQFEEAQQIFNDGGKPHSMELDENSLQGFWSKGENSDYEFFIINDAVFSKLCILGDDVEPCFEGSAITAPNISKNFTLDDEFKSTLYSMMKQLQETLQGGNYTVADEIKKKSVDSSEVINEEAVTEVEEPVVDNSSSDTPSIEEPAVNEGSTDTPEENSNTETPSAEDGQSAIESTETESGDTQGDDGADGGDGSSDGGDGSTDYAKKDDEEAEDKEESNEKSSEDAKEEDDEEDTKKKYSLLVIEFEELQKSYNELQAQAEETSKLLEQFKSYAAAVENEKKDALIAEFYMLSDEDKKDVIDHKTEYTLDEIKSKLAVLCYDKKVNFDQSDEKSEEDVTVKIDSYSSTAGMPEWLQAVEQHKNQ